MLAASEDKMEVQKEHVNIEFFDEASIENLITCFQEND